MKLHLLAEAGCASQVAKRINTCMCAMQWLQRLQRWPGERCVDRDVWRQCLHAANQRAKGARLG